MPLALAVLVIWPAMQSVSKLAAGHGRSYWWEVVHADPILDAGPMWFAEVLLVYSLAYAAWRHWRPRGRPPAEAASLTGRRVVALAATVSVATVLVRMVFPIEGGQADQAQLWQWPAYIAMFGLGIAAARHGWLDPVPEPIRRRCGKAALLGLLGVFILMVAVAAAGLEPDVFFDLRLHWAPLTLAALEGPVAVGAGVWLLALAQRRLNRPPDRVGRASRKAPTPPTSRRAPCSSGSRSRSGVQNCRPRSRRSPWPARRRRLVRTRLAPRHPHAARPHPLSPTPASAV